MANSNNLTAQQRAVLFGASTRQHFQMLGMQEVKGGMQTVSFRVPKSRIMAGVKLLVEGKIKLTHASETSYTLGDVDIYKALRRISIDFNNGFNPIVVSGDEMALINMLYPAPEMVKRGTGETLCTVAEKLTASSGGAENDFSFMLDVPLTINYRDPVGLVLAQNAETNIDINIDIANAAAVVNNASGFTADFTSVKVTPMIASFSIPSDTRAFPDMSVLKIVDSRNEVFTSGLSYIKLPVGMIYRKLIFKFETTDGAPLDLEHITSNIELVFNTADVPYSVSPKMLKQINTMQAGMAYPSNCLYFSFDYQGVNGYGGSRDYIDAERITELALRFSADCGGKITIVSEKLSRLIAG